MVFVGLSGDELNQEYQLSMLFGNSSGNQIVMVEGETEMSFDIASSLVTRLRMHADFQALYMVDDYYGNYEDYSQGEFEKVGISVDLTDSQFINSSWTKKSFLSK